MQFKKNINNKLNTCILLILSLFINYSVQDLPVHCLKRKWIIIASELIPVKNSYEMKCGHDLPSNELTSYLAKSPYEMSKKFEVNLRDLDDAELVTNDRINHQGKWTMVYDEGYSMDFDEYSFFAFSKYMIDNSNFSKAEYNSLCYSTCVGWYHNKDKSKWGCYIANKVNTNPNEITSRDAKNLVNIIEPKNILENNIISSMLNMQFKSIGNDIKFESGEKQTLDIDKNNSNYGIQNYGLFNISNKYMKKLDRNLRKSVEILQNPSSFLQIQVQTKTKTKEKLFSSLRLNSSFKNHALYVSKLRQIKKNWEADVNPQFSQMTIKELNKFAGIQRSNNAKTHIHKLNKKYTSEDVSEFPKFFDWKKVLRFAGSQGNCGSCYAYSTIRMIEARLKIKYDHDVRLSIQHALDCDIYNQGCDGGYPFLVMKFAAENALLPEICKPYSERTGRCGQNTCDPSLLPYLYKTKNYQYIGGSYGQCSEKKMMKELYEKGPFVVSFEPDYNFMMYKSGIYHSIDEKTWISRGMPKPEWEKVDHSVLLVGWGEDEDTKEKYWIIQNTWGPQWGENGYFRMRRGLDEFGIESICEAADPIVIEQLTNRILERKDFELIKNSLHNNIDSSEESSFLKGLNNLNSSFDNNSIYSDTQINPFEDSINNNNANRIISEEKMPMISLSSELDKPTYN